MKYIRTKTTIATMFEGHIDNLEEIHGVLTSLRVHEHTCQLKLKNEYSLFNVRIMSVLPIDKDQFQFTILGKSSTLKKWAKISELEEMHVDTNDHYVVRTKPGIERWHLINPAGDL